MKIITFSKRAFNKLSPFVLDKTITATEGKFYTFTKDGKEMLLKKLYYTEGKLFSDKLSILEYLDYYKEYLPKEFCPPSALVSVGGEIKGLAIDKIDGINYHLFLSNPEYSVDDKIKSLTKIGGIFEALKDTRKNTSLKNIYINDVHEGNFIINPNTGNISVVDLDSAKIRDDINFPAKYMTEKSIINSCYKYKVNEDYNNNFYSNTGYIKADENSDLFCYNIMILNYLYQGNVSEMNINEFYEYLNYLQSLNVNKDLLDSFSKIVTSGKNINPREYLDSLNYKQLFYSKKSEYKKLIK